MDYNGQKMNNEELKILLLYLLKQLNSICEEANIPYYAGGGTCIGALRNKGIIPWDDDIDVLMPRKYYYDFIEKCNSKLESPILIRTRENDPYFCQEYIKLCFKDDVFGYSDISLDVFFLDETNPKRKIFRALQNRILLDLYAIKKYKVSRMQGNKKYTPRNIFKRFYISVLSHIFSLNFIEKIHKKTMLLEKKETEFCIDWGSCYSYKKRATYKKKWFGVPQKAPFENTYIYLPQDANSLNEYVFGKDWMTPPPPEKRINHGVKRLNNNDVDIEAIKKEINW